MNNLLYDLIVTEFLLTAALLLVARTLYRIEQILRSIIDPEKKAIRMFDTERATVYKTHLGGKLSGEEKP